MSGAARAVFGVAVAFITSVGTATVRADGLDGTAQQALVDRLLAAQRQIRTYNVILKEEYHASPQARSPEEADRMMEDIVIGAESTAGGPVEVDEAEMEALRAGERRGLLQETSYSQLCSLGGVGRQQARIWARNDATGDLLTVTDGTSFLMHQREERYDDFHDFTVTIGRPRELSYFGIPPDFGYPYGYWLSRGEVTGFTDSEDGLEQVVTLRLYDGSGTVVMHIDPLRGDMARRVERRDAEGRLTVCYTAEDEQQVNGIWFPMLAAETEYVEEGGKLRMKSKRVRTVTDVSLNLTLDPDEFRLILPPGAIVTDQRTDPEGMFETARTPPVPPLPKSEE